MSGMLCLRFCIFVSVFALFRLAALGSEEKRPFPQHTVYTKGTIKPSAKNQVELDLAVIEFYRAWKAKYLRTAADGQQRYVFCNVDKTFPKNTHSVSEGHGYGMLAAVLMAGADPEARADFDGLYRFFRAHPADHNTDLMAWRQISKKKNGALTEEPDERDSATDGDLDIACALLMADAQWGSRGTINYRKEALKVIAAIKKSETDPERHTLTLGSWVDRENSHWGGTRPSDFMPAHFKSFGEATGDPVWSQITDATYRLFHELAAAQNPQTGLIPDFVVWKGNRFQPAPPNYLETKEDGHYSYNSCRVPWRVGTDYLLTGDPRALKLLQPLNAWIQKTTGGKPEKINAGYHLDGKILDEDESGAFTAPMAVAAMTDPNSQAWLDALWANLLARDVAREHYFENSLKLMTMIVVSGNWWQ